MPQIYEKQGAERMLIMSKKAKKSKKARKKQYYQQKGSKSASQVKQKKQITSAEAKPKQEIQTSKTKQSKQSSNSKQKTQVSKNKQQGKQTPKTKQETKKSKTKQQGKQVSKSKQESQKSKTKQGKEVSKTKQEAQKSKTKEQGKQVSKSKQETKKSKIKQQGKQVSKSKQENQKSKSQQGKEVSKTKQEAQKSKTKQQGKQVSKSKHEAQKSKSQQGKQVSKSKQESQKSKSQQGKQVPKKKQQTQDKVKSLRPIQPEKGKKRKQDKKRLELEETAVSAKGKGKNKRKKWRVLKFFFLSLLIASLALIGYGVSILRRVNNLITEAYVEVEQEFIREEPLQFGEEPFSILLLGVDVDDISEQAISDAIMLVTVNPNTNSTKILSLHREMWIEGSEMWQWYTDDEKHRWDRLGYRYTFRGPEGAINTIQDILNVPIDRFLVLDMVGFALIIDELDGISIYNDTTAFSQGGDYFPLGELELKGDEALNFIRMRMDDPDGDFGRQARQRLVVNAALSLIEESIVLRHNDILNAAEGHMSMNISSGDLITVLRNYMGATANVTMLDLRGERFVMNDEHLFIIVDDEDIAEMSQLLRNHLELDELEPESTEPESESVSGD